MAYCRIGLAVTVPVNGSWDETDTEYYDVTCFRDLAEHAAECLSKGMRVVVVGRGEVETWTGDDGEERTSKKIVADGIGPDLRWATASVEKVSKGGRARAEVADDEEPF